MKYTMKSRKLQRDVTFYRPGDYYIYADLNGRPGSFGHHICKNGALSGSCLGVLGDDYDDNTKQQFERVCKAWLKSYVSSLEPDL